MTDHLLLEDRIKHTLHGCLNVLDRLIDDLVQSDINALALCRCLSRRIRTHVKADNDRVGRTRKGDIGLVDCADTAVNTLYDNLLVGELHQRLLHRLDASLYIRLDNQVQLLQITLLNL